MDIFFYLLSNLFPLYILIGLGFIAGRYFEVDRKSLANLAIFIVVPVVTFGFVTKLDFRIEYILLPIILFCMRTAIGLGLLAVGKRVFGDNRANLLAMCGTMGNTGYFGLPLVMLLFDTQWTAVYMFMMAGCLTFEATVGYYIAARGNFTVRESLIRLAKFPTLYALALGLAANLAGAHLPPQFDIYWTHFKGAYVLIGMMIIGVALSRAPKLVIAPRFLSLAFLGKFVLWPLTAAALILLDRTVTHLFPEEVYKLLVIISLVPPAANITAFAAQLDLKPEKAATTVLLGTIFALFYIPAVLALTGMFQG